MSASVKNIDITLEYEILTEIVRPMLGAVDQAVDVSGPALAALVPRPWRNICGSSRTAIAAALQSADLRLWRSCFRETTPADLSTITQANHVVRLVAATSPWVDLFHDLGVERPHRMARPLGPLSIAFGFSVDRSDPYVARVLNYYGPLLDQAHTPIR